MRKLIIGASLFIGFLFVVFTILKVTGVFTYYTARSPSNYPTFNPGDYIFSSNKIKPRLLDLICFSTKGVTEENQVYMFRLCGMEGDSLEIKNGVLFVNGINRDKELNLSHSYMAPNGILGQLKQLDVINGTDKVAMSYGNDSNVVHIPDRIVKNEKLPVRRLDGSGAEGWIREKFKADWTVDNFGPIKIPAGKYFVLGDSRHNAMDSRLIGFIPVENYRGTVVNR